MLLVSIHEIDIRARVECKIYQSRSIVQVLSLYVCAGILDVLFATGVCLNVSPVLEIFSIGGSSLCRG